MNKGTKVLLVVEGQIFEGEILTGSSSDSQLVSFTKNGQTCSTYKRVDELKVVEPKSVVDYQSLHEESQEIINNYRQALEILQISITGIRCSSTLEQAQSFAYEAQKSISLCNILNEELSATNEAPTRQGVGYHAEGSDMGRTFGQNYYNF